MKNNTILFLISLIGYVGYSQGSNRVTNQFSVEAAYGISMPLDYVSYFSDDKFNSTTHFEAGVRFMFTEIWGVKGEVVFDNFNESGQSGFGTKAVRIDAQAFYNMGKSIGLVYSTNEKIGLLAHSGFGVGSVKSEYYTDDNERIGNFIIGITPLFNLSEYFALSADFSYIMDFRQHFYFDGVPISQTPNTTKEYVTAGQFAVTIGAIFYIGSNGNEADWR